MCVLPARSLIGFSLAHASASLGAVSYEDRVCMVKHQFTSRQL